MKNIFITGKVGVGKSTVLVKALDMLLPIVCGGFFTRSAEPITDDARLDVFIEKAWEKTPHDKAHLVGSRLGGQKLKRYPGAFDMAGVEILANTPSDATFIIMDELGVIESDAAIFRKAVLDMLDGPLPVIGVIKDKQTEFLDEIRQHPDSLVFEVTNKNRDSLTFFIKDILMFL